MTTVAVARWVTPATRGRVAADRSRRGATTRRGARVKTRAVSPSGLPADNPENPKSDAKKASSKSSKAPGDPSSSSFSSSSPAAPSPDDEAANVEARAKLQISLEARNDVRERMDAAVAAEDFETAAKLRDELTELQNADPLFVATLKMNAAIEEERYEDAAKHRDEIAALTPPPAPKPPRRKPPVPCESDETTEGVNVRVHSQYVASRSDPSSNQYFFAYSVRITNTSSEIVQLRDRHWIIKDDDGHVDEVKGPGVIGEQPVLLPGQVRSIHWFPYDRVGVVNADPQGLLPAHLSAHPSVSIPAIDAFQLRF